LYVQTITSSVDFVTGSTRFGSELTNTHLFTGSVTITGSLAVNGSTAILTNQTGAMSVATASYVANAVSASYASTASLAPLYLPLAGGTMTGDIYAAGRTFTFQDLLLGAGTTFGKLTTDGSKYISIMPTYNVESARFWPNGNVTIQDAGTYVDNGFKLDVSGSGRFTNGLTVTGSLNAVNGVTGSLLGTSSFADNATSASYALTASYSANVPETASFAVSASQAQNAVSAAYSAYALTSSYSLAGSGFPFSGSAVITGSLLITNLSSSGVSYLVADSTGFITAQSGSAAIFQTQIYTASAGQTTFAITNGYATGLINVFVNGTKLNPSEYNDTNGTTIVLATGSFVDDIVEFNKYLPASGVTNNSLRQQTTFTASAGQTVFSASYTPGLLDIFYNGSRLSGNEYTANNGTFITLATGSADGDILDVFVYSYQVGAFSGIGGAGVANEISYFNTTNSITSSAAITISGANAIVTGSLLGTASYATNANLLDGLDSSVFVPTGSFNTFSSSILTYTGSANSRFSALETTSGSNITRIAALEVTSGSTITRLNSIESTTGSLNAASGSAITRLSALEVTSGSNITRINALETASGSAITRLSSIETTTGSLNAASGSAITRLSSLESKTGSYATTGSNIFVDGQYLSSSFNPTGFSTTASLYTDGGLRVSRDAYISGTLYLNNVTVFGTQSVAYISSSQLNIGTNLITVNTDTPSIRFGGLAVYDSGSTGLTGSILWDSQNNHWVYSNPSGSSYSGGMFISGPRTSTLGSETGTTSNALMKGQGGDHITSSAIFENGASASFYTNALVVSASGDTQFGSVINNTHQFTGSVSVSGSIISSSPITGSGFSTTANVNLGNFDLTSKYLISDGSAGLGGVISIRQDATYLPKGNGYSSIASSPSVFEFYGYTGASTYKNFTLRFDGLTNNTRREYTLPDACGTLALLSGTQNFTGTVCAPSFISSGTICSTGNTCFGGTSIITGCLGIGITPTQRLTVAGNVLLSGASTSLNFSTAASGNADISFNGTSFTLVSNSSSANLILSTSSTERFRIAANGTACFACELTAKTLGTNDLILNNLNYECANYVDGTRGSWLIQEGACDLFIINQISCKKYKFNLIEIK
jgi:hypothetical protein